MKAQNPPPAELLLTRRLLRINDIPGAQETIIHYEEKRQSSDSDGSASTSTHSCHQQTRQAETSRGPALKRPGSSPEQHKYFASSSKALPVPITFPGDAYGAWMSLKPSRAAQIRAVSCLQEPGSSNELLGPPFLAICPLALVALRRRVPLLPPAEPSLLVYHSMAQGQSAEPSRGTRLLNKWKEIKQAASSCPHT